jgi:hypothetical protein
MRSAYASLAALLALAACASGPDPDMIQSGGSAAAAGPGYCETTPAPEDEARWNELCFSGGEDR